MLTSSLDLISDINNALTHKRDVRVNIRSVLDLIQKALGLSSAIVFLEQPETETLTIAAANGLEAADFRRLETRAGRGAFQEVFESGEPIVINMIKADPSFGFLGAGLQSRLHVVPILLEHHSLGVLSVVLDTEFKDLAKLLPLIASMIAQTLRIEHSVRGERQKLIEENSHLKQELKEKHEFTHIIGTSNPMKHVYDQVTQVARSNATVLLRGESGTGKEMIANAIHYNSLRSKRPLIKINCAALPDTLIESELFGHEKGAFTGADRFKKGRFDMADGGTLFLDEIGDLPLQTQIKLLRVLQEREFERLGGGDTIRTNIRLITATNKNLEEAIAKGDFREDLYYRLNVFTIHLPPLRERKSDILLLAEHFLEKYEIEHGKRIRRISTPAIDMLMSYHFPGNVRELENAIERAVLVCDANVIHGHHLPPTLQTAEVSGTMTNLTLASAVEAFERDMIQDTLKSTGGNIAKAAKTLDSTERILGYKIKKYGIDTIRFRRKKPESDGR
ncbi:MAG: sigma 54-interacting transcriptional regulator [Saprospiraceae bacterium]|nr:sigma 54-interacting transcriptional regulator [Pyrinomonadaceae bacterium]